MSHIPRYNKGDTAVDDPRSPLPAVEPAEPKVQEVWYNISHDDDSNSRIYRDVVQS